MYFIYIINLTYINNNKIHKHKYEAKMHIISNFSNNI